MPKNIEKEALKQLGRLEQMHPDSAESGMLRTFLDWMVEIPWSKSTRDSLDIKRAQVILDEDHYCLEKIKERILEFLGRPQAAQEDEGADSLFCRTAGGRQNLSGQIHRQSHGAQVCQDVAGRHAR